MKSITAFAVWLAFVGMAIITGCGNDEPAQTKGADPIAHTDPAALQLAQEVARTAAGDWDLLTPAQQQPFLNLHAGNVAKAKRQFETMFEEAKATR